jgi:Mn-containing catalase
MFLCIDRLRIKPPQPKDASPDRAAAVQELPGGRCGETPALMNWACVSAREW